MMSSKSSVPVVAPKSFSAENIARALNIDEIIQRHEAHIRDLVGALELADELLHSAEMQRIAVKARGFAKVCRAVRFTLQKMRQP